MEDEHFFLFVGYMKEELPSAYDRNAKKVHRVLLHVKRATLQKKPRDYADVLYTRVPVEFDPLGKQLAYLVVLFGQVETSEVLLQTSFYFIDILEKEEEAQEVKKKAERGEYNSHFAKQEKLYKAEVIPVLITPN